MMLVVFLILLLTIIRYRKPIIGRNSDIIFIVVGLCSVMLGFLYLMGLIYGYDVSYSVIYKKYISTTMWATTFLVVIITEIIRYVLSLVDTRQKKRYWLLTIIMLANFVMIDLAIATKTYDFSNFNQLYEFFGLVFIQSIAKNILLNYISKKYGYVPCLCYRLIMDLYIYFMPLTPDINVFIEAVLLLVFPYFVYVLIKELTERKKLEPASKNKTADRVSTVILSIIFGILVILVSREFNYAMIAIGSESMTGTINKGDAIVYQKYDMDKMELKEGDIIVFAKNNMMIVHRVVKVYTLNEGEYVYQTKGDYNDNVDNWVVTQQEVIGKVKTRVLWIAWPSVLLNEWF